MEPIDLTNLRYDLSAKLKYRSVPELSRETVESWKDRIEKLIQEVRAILVGQEEMLETLLIGVLADGHVLLKGVPGVGKSTAIHSLSQTMGLETRKIRNSADFIGPNLLILEEFEYLDSSFQANLLMAMQEGRILFRNEEIYLDKPFSVLATTNPLKDEMPGISPAQLDRFLLSMAVPPNSLNEELEILKRHQCEEPSLPCLFSTTEILAMQRLIPKVHIPESMAALLAGAIVKIRNRIPDHHALSTRAVLGYARACQALAFRNGRAEISIQDLKALLSRALRHRIFPEQKSLAEEVLLETEAWLDTQEPDSSNGL